MIISGRLQFILGALCTVSMVACASEDGARAEWQTVRDSLVVPEAAFRALFADAALEPPALDFRGDTIRKRVIAPTDTAGFAPLSSTWLRVAESEGYTIVGGPDQVEPGAYYLVLDTVSVTGANKIDITIAAGLTDGGLTCSSSVSCEDGKCQSGGISCNDVIDYLVTPGRISVGRLRPVLVLTPEHWPEF